MQSLLSKEKSDSFIEKRENLKIKYEQNAIDRLGSTRITF